MVKLPHKPIKCTVVSPLVGNLSICSQNINQYNVMTTEKEIEIIRWMKDNYPTFETNTTQIWQMARMLNDYHESEVKKLNILAVSSLVCPKCKSDAIAGYPNYKECRICGNVW